MHPFVLVLARLALGITWITAGVAKLTAGDGRDDGVAKFGLLSDRVARPVGRGLPFVELVLGSLLVAGLWVVPAAATSAILLAAFSAVIALNLIRGREIECHCFGQLGRGPISGWSVARNLVLLAFAAAQLVWPSGYLALDGIIHPGVTYGPVPPAADFLPVLFLAGAATLLCALGDSSWRLARAVASAERGPALSSADRQFLRRWLRPSSLPGAARTRR